MRETYTGTAHFVRLEDAERYYSEQGYDDVKKAVRSKINAGEIFLGKPAVKDGETVLVNQKEGRYFIKSKGV